MSTPHTTQQDEGIHRSLVRAGIRSRYHRQTLGDSKSTHAAELYDWIMGISMEAKDAGWTFIGGNETEDLSILVARGLHLTGRACMVMTSIRFQELLSGDRGYLESTTENAQTLLLTQMGPQDQKEDIVFTSREIRIMENWLLDWLADGKRLLIHASRPLEGSWFSGLFLQRVATVNTTIREDL